jgi:hypothetical protein
MQFMMSSSIMVVIGPWYIPLVKGTHSFFMTMNSSIDLQYFYPPNIYFSSFFFPNHIKLLPLHIALHVLGEGRVKISWNCSFNAFFLGDSCSLELSFVCGRTGVYV